MLTSASNSLSVNTAESLSASGRMLTNVPDREAVRALLALPRFRHWLEARPPTEVVGRCEMAGACPLAIYLIDQGLIRPNVSGTTVDWATFDWGSRCALSTDDYRTTRLHEWCVTFISRIDRLHPLSGERHPVVTAADALAVLEGLDLEVVGLAAA